MDASEQVKLMQRQLSSKDKVLQQRSENTELLEQGDHTRPRHGTRTLCHCTHAEPLQGPCVDACACNLGVQALTRLC